MKRCNCFKNWARRDWILLSHVFVIFAILNFSSTVSAALEYDGFGLISFIFAFLHGPLMLLAVLLRYLIMLVSDSVAYVFFWGIVLFSYYGGATLLWTAIIFPFYRKFANKRLK